MGILAHPTLLQKYFGYSKLRDLLGGKEKVLVVDDKPYFREVLALLLKQHGYECEEDCNAFAAMSRFENNHADLVTTDIHQGWCLEEEGKWIPRPTGIELVEYLSKKSGEKPSTMIVVSGNMYYSPTYSERGREARLKACSQNLLKKKYY